LAASGAKAFDYFKWCGTTEELAEKLGFRYLRGYLASWHDSIEAEFFSSLLISSNVVGLE